MYPSFPACLLALILLLAACAPAISQASLTEIAASPTGAAILTSITPSTPSPTPPPTPAATLTPTPGPVSFPTTLSGAAIAYDPSREEVVVFGGRHPLTNQMIAETWIWDGAAWTLQQPPVTPPAREGAALAYDPVHQQMLLFGGIDPNSEQIFNDTWLWDGRAWTELHPPAAPAGRIGPGLAADLNHKIVVLFGGLVGTGRTSQYGNDTWLWDGATWSLVAPSHLPAAALDPQLDYDPIQNQVVFTAWPGSSDQLICRWAWTGQDWEETCLPSAPSARYGQAFAFDAARNQAVVFGGRDARPDSHSDYLTDTWTGGAEGWTQVQAVLPETQTPPRSTVICATILNEKGGVGRLSSLVSSRLVYDAARARMLLFTQNREEPPRFVQWAWETDHWQELAAGSADLPASQPPGEDWVRIANGNFIAHEEKPLRWLEHYIQADVPADQQLADFKIRQSDGPYGPETEAQKVAGRFYRVTVDVQPVTLAGSAWNDGNGQAGADGWITGKQLTLGEWYQDALACDTWMKNFP
jgi:hypothetical protein